MRLRIAPSLAQELTMLNDQDAEEMADEIGDKRLTLREVRRIIRHRQSKETTTLEPSGAFGESNRGDVEKRVRRVSRELNIAIASLGGAVIRLGEVAEDLEREWVVRESIFMCRDSIRDQIENLTRLKRKYERAEDANPGILSLMG